MKVFNTKKGIVVDHEGALFLAKETDWNSFVNRSQLYKKLLDEVKQLNADPALSTVINEQVLTPLGSQELWASGVTYLRSRKARMEESVDSGGGDFYARVYEAERPEIFFKAPAYRTVGSGMEVRIRKDSKWNVPEPELTLFISSSGTIEGYTIGNDMSSRDIEGENPLYLPQAKSYDGAAAIGPCLYVPEAPIHPETLISITIERNTKSVFNGEISINQMKRKHNELVEYLFREMSFSSGVYLMTGTGIVPPNEFTLQKGDVVKITIENIGTLENTVA
jgi:2-dehydro-3-deoxy-D-arabinonate dehydratase